MSLRERNQAETSETEKYEKNATEREAIDPSVWSGKVEGHDSSVPPEEHTIASSEGTSSEVDDKAPDGGKAAWLQVLGSWMVVFNTGGLMVIFGDYQTFYESGTLFHESSSNISWIGSVQTLMVFAVGAVVGPVYDRGYLRTLLVIGSIGVVLGHMLLSLCTQYWQAFLAQGLFVGISGGCVFVPALAVVQPYFDRHLGLAVGIVATGSSVGAVIYPVIFANVLEHLGFAWAVRIMGFVSCITFAMPLLVLRQRFKPAKVRKIIDLSVFQDGVFMACVFACFLSYASNFLAFFYISFFGQSSGWMSTNMALYLVPILNAISAVGRVLPNWLADKVGAINVVIPGSFFLATVLLCNLAVQSAAGLITTTILFGLFSGIFIAMPPLLFMVLTKDKAKLGNRMGMAFTVIGSAALVGGPGGGGVLRHSPGHLDWTAAWIFGASLQFFACIIFVILRVWQGGFKLKVKI